MAKKSIENKLLAVVRVRGRVNVRGKISETLQRLNLKRVNNLVLLYGSKTNLGMIERCKDYITYGEVSSDIVKELFTAKGIKAEESSISEIATGAKSMRTLGMDVPIRMKPPRHGYEAIKLSYTEGGTLGYRGEEMGKLLKRMM